MSKPIERVEIITGIQRRRRYTAEEKVRLVEQTIQPGMTVSALARLHGVSPSLLFQWRGSEHANTHGCRSSQK
jgi:transposase